MSHDTWLDRWLPLIAERAAGSPVLELGCGSGEDTATLLAARLDVIAVDIDAAAVERARRRAPAAQIYCQDIRRPFPTAGLALGAVVASLSLHYFLWKETVSLVGGIRDALRPTGLLVCRLNSTEDRHFGAEGHPEIEPNYYS